MLAFAEPDAPVDADLHRQVRDRFARLGVVVEVPERLMGVAGAAMGVAPAYWALIVEARVDAAVRRGCPSRPRRRSCARAWPAPPSCCATTTATRSRSGAP